MQDGGGKEVVEGGGEWGKKWHILLLVPGG